MNRKVILKKEIIKASVFSFHQTKLTLIGEYVNVNVKDDQPNEPIVGLT